jgi:hypothetical protein
MSSIARALYGEDKRKVGGTLKEYDGETLARIRTRIIMVGSWTLL